MRVWAAISDEVISNMVETAINIRWPSSGQLVPYGLSETGRLDGIDNCDLALVDMDLKDADPNEIIRRISEVSDVPLIALSSITTDKSSGPKVLSDGAVDYLIKPIELIDLIFHMESFAKG